jgi:hypothetical protein
MKIWPYHNCCRYRFYFTFYNGYSFEKNWFLICSKNPSIIILMRSIFEHVPRLWWYQGGLEEGWRMCLSWRYSEGLDGRMIHVLHPRQCLRKLEGGSNMCSTFDGAWEEIKKMRHVLHPLNTCLNKKRGETCAPFIAMHGWTRRMMKYVSHPLHACVN